MKERSCLITFPNTKERVENATRSGVLSTNSEVSENLVKHGLLGLIYLL